MTLPFEKRTVFGPSGNGNLGIVTAEIAAAINCNAGPIKLLNGVEGRAGGFGNAHIEARRLTQIQGMGFKDVLGYARFIAAGFELIALQEDGRLVFVRERGATYHRIVCQWDDELAIWSITTAFTKASVAGLTFVWPAKTT